MFVEGSRRSFLLVLAILIACFAGPFDSGASAATVAVPSNLTLNVRESTGVARSGEIVRSGVPLARSLNDSPGHIIWNYNRVLTNTAGIRTLLAHSFYTEPAIPPPPAPDAPLAAEPPPPLEFVERANGEAMNSQLSV